MNNNSYFQENFGAFVTNFDWNETEIHLCSVYVIMLALMVYTCFCYLIFRNGSLAILDHNIQSAKSRSMEELGIKVREN